jgi:hypothetical protein
LGQEMGGADEGVAAADEALKTEWLSQAGAMIDAVTHGTELGLCRCCPGSRLGSIRGH